MDKLVDREQVGAMELGEQVSNRGRGWDMWKVNVGDVGGVNGVSIGQLDWDRVGRWALVVNRGSEGEEVAGGAGVYNSCCVWGGTSWCGNSFAS